MIPISDADFDRAVAAALRAIPGEFRRYLDNVVIEVHAAPGADLDVPGDTLGLYIGVPLEEKADPGVSVSLPDRVILFRDNLCALCASREELIDEIRITLLHEIGHHFGLDEDQLAELGYD